MIGASGGSVSWGMAEPDEPIRYMERTRDWYLALGYGNPYRWAHFDDVRSSRSRARSPSAL